LVWLIPVAFLVLNLFLEPDPRGHGTHQQLGLPACGARDLVGLPCPACGVTTSVTELVHGRPLRSFVVQPFGFALAVGALAFFLWALRVHRRGDDTWAILMERVPDRWVRGVMLFVLAGWLWRIGLERWAL